MQFLISACISEDALAVSIIENTNKSRFSNQSFLSHITKYMEVDWVLAWLFRA